MRLSGTKTGSINQYNGLGDQLYDLGGARPTLDLNFASNGSLVDSVTGKTLVTHTRASNATYVDGDGIIKDATTNEARFDHDPETGESLGLLVEESRTNLQSYSEDFTTGWAASSGSTVDADDATSPDGTTNADKYSVGTSTFPQVTQSVATTVSAVHTLTVYAKAAGKNFVQVRLRNAGATGNYFRAVFNLTDGSITQAAAFGNGVYTSSSATDVGNGWWRLSVTGTADTSGTSATTLFILTHDADGTIATPSNSAATDGVLLWGAQLEAGSFATSYIRTEGSTVTRSADVASITGTNFSSWYNQTEGTVFSDSNIIATGQTQLVWRLTGGTYSTSLRQPHSTGTQFRAVIGDTFSASPGTGGTIPGVTKAAVSFSGTAGRFQVGTSGVDVTASGAPDPNALNIGTYTTSTHLNGTIRRLTYWPTRLSNDTLQTITK